VSNPIILPRAHTFIAQVQYDAPLHTNIDAIQCGLQINLGQIMACSLGCLRQLTHSEPHKITHRARSGPPNRAVCISVPNPQTNPISTYWRSHQYLDRRSLARVLRRPTNSRCLTRRKTRPRWYGTVPSKIGQAYPQPPNIQAMTATGKDPTKEIMAIIKMGRPLAPSMPPRMAPRSMR
jgi:hypothetical protein